jgi:DNA polymerase III epsilon subunit family exonuclease
MATLGLELEATASPAPGRVPTSSQREAIEAPAGALLVLAGPGAGKTYCLIERIRFLIERLEVAPERIRAFTFTNKAAGEIEERLERTLGDRVGEVKSGTLHAFCAELLRELGPTIGLASGFGIADENYQRAVLRRLAIPPRLHRRVLAAFAEHRFCGVPLEPRDREHFDKYLRFLQARNVLDFDMLLLETAVLFENAQLAATVRARWDCILVDEFQDLNPVQYGIVRALAREHKHVFAVGDDEQSIYSWAGADPRVFRVFANDFGITRAHHLRENHRSPRQIFQLARQLVDINPRLFDEKRESQVGHESPFPVVAHNFATDDAELAWLISDLRRDRQEYGRPWGDYALLYRKHAIGHAAEAALIGAGLPCRLAQGRALGEDPVVRYVVAALRVISHPDDVNQEGFLEVVLPKALLHSARAKAQEQGQPLRRQLERILRTLPRHHGDARKIRRAFYAVENLVAIGHKHTSLAALVEELLSQRVGEYRTVLEEHHDSLTDPVGHEEVVRLAERLAEALQTRRPVWLPRLGGAEIGLKGLLIGVGVSVVHLGGTIPDGALAIGVDDSPSLGLPLGLFKAAQIVCSRGFNNAFRDFTAIDLETTGNNVGRAEIVEIAAVRVRDGLIVDERYSLVKPRVPITPGALKTHGITDADVANAPFFEDVWPEFRAFCGGDVLVAHNGYQFDFPILRRMTKDLPDAGELVTYDTLPLARDLHPGSGKLVHLAERFGIDAGESHHALDDTRTLARVFLALGEAKVVRARKTVLVNLLDHLGIALALSNQTGLDAEAELLRGLCPPYSLGRYSDCLEFYRGEREEADDPSLPTVRQVVERLGGEQMMNRIRTARTAVERYPVAMGRLRRLLGRYGAGTLQEQITRFLESVALSRSDGFDPARERVNLLTLHSTKGLEFSRVYVLGAEDAQLPGGTPTRAPTPEEIQEARRLLYVGMTRAKDRLVLTRVEARGGRPTGGHRFLSEMGLQPGSGGTT